MEHRDTTTSKPQDSLLWPPGSVKTTIPDVRFFLGIDPGASGGLALISTDGQVTCGPSDRTDRDLWDLLKDCGADFAVIERQIARPTVYVDKRTGKRVSTVLASTVTLYGGYRYLEGILTASEIPFEAIGPQIWQRSLGLGNSKGLTRTQWKGKLKEVAQRRFPKVKVTLATADALLIALYAMEKYKGVV